MIRGRNIVCVASNWFEHPTSKQHVMRALAADNHIIWVNFHASRRPQFNGRDARLILRRLAGLRRRTQRVAPTIDTLNPLLIPWPESAVARRLNAALLARQIRRALRELPPAPVQLWLFTPDTPELIPQLRPEHTVYYCVDDFAAFAGYNAPLIERLEARTMAASDTVITTSDALYAARADRHRAVHLVPHGVDYAHFALAVGGGAGALPADLANIPRPIFGFMGLISEWLDAELLTTVAAARPDWSFVLLGDARCDVGRLQAQPNIHLLGGKPYAQLPAYCQGFDVGIIPFCVSRLTRAVNPIKLREYLAAGLPVVSTPMPAVAEYAPAAQVARNADEFVAACTRALDQARTEAPQTRQRMVRQDGWPARVEWLSAIVEQRLSTGQSPRSIDEQLRDEPARRLHPRPAVRRTQVDYAPSR